MGGEAKETGLRGPLAGAGQAEINVSPGHRYLLAQGAWVSVCWPLTSDHRTLRVVLQAGARMSWLSPTYLPLVVTFDPFHHQLWFQLRNRYHVDTLGRLCPRESLSQRGETGGPLVCGLREIYSGNALSYGCPPPPSLS